MLTLIQGDVLTAIVRQSHSADFKVFINFLKEEEKTLALKSIKRKNETECKWLQGAAQIISELINEIEVVSDRFNKLQEKAKKGKRT